MSELIVEYSRPAAERDGTHLVVLLHGYGSHEQDLLGLLPALPQEGFTYASLRAPERVPGGMGFQWFPLTGGPGEFGMDVAEAEAAFEQVTHWIETHREGYADVTLLGFSQGMSVATSVVRRRPELVRAVVGLSGFVVDQPSESFDDAALLARFPKLPFFYGRDQEDPVIGPERAAFSLDWLREHTDLTKVVYAGIGHSVSNQEIGHVGEFLRHALAD